MMRRAAHSLLVIVAAALAGCATEDVFREPPPGPDPAVTNALAVYVPTLAPAASGEGFLGIAAGWDRAAFRVGDGTGAAPAWFVHERPGAEAVSHPLRTQEHLIWVGSPPGPEPDLTQESTRAVIVAATDGSLVRTIPLDTIGIEGVSRMTVDSAGRLVVLDTSAEGPDGEPAFAVAREAETGAFDLTWHPRPDSDSRLWLAWDGSCVVMETIDTFDENLLARAVRIDLATGHEVDIPIAPDDRIRGVSPDGWDVLVTDDGHHDRAPPEIVRIPTGTRTDLGLSRFRPVEWLPQGIVGVWASAWHAYDRTTGAWSSGPILEDAFIVPDPTASGPPLVLHRTDGRYLVEVGSTTSVTDARWIEGTETALDVSARTGAIALAVEDGVEIHDGDGTRRYEVRDVDSVRFRPDGTLLILSGPYYSGIRLWEVAEGAEEAREIRFVSVDSRRTARLGYDPVTERALVIVTGFDTDNGFSVIAIPDEGPPELLAERAGSPLFLSRGDDPVSDLLGPVLVYEALDGLLYVERLDGSDDTLRIQVRPVPRHIHAAALDPTRPDLLVTGRTAFGEGLVQRNSVYSRRGGGE